MLLLASPFSRVFGATITLKLSEPQSLPAGSREVVRISFTLLCSSLL